RDQDQPGSRGAGSRGRSVNGPAPHEAEPGRSERNLGDDDYSPCRMANSRRNSRYSHTRVTVRPNAAVQAYLEGIPALTPFSTKSKSRIRKKAASVIANSPIAIPRNPLRKPKGLSVHPANCATRLMTM